jgi:hypothetical protein
MTIKTARQKKPPKKGRQVMAALPHRSFDLGRQNSEMFSQPCEQLPLFLVGGQVSDHLALGYLHAESFQVGLHVLHRKRCASFANRPGG